MTALIYIKSASLAIAFALGSASNAFSTPILNGNFEDPVVPGGPGALLTFSAGETFGGVWRVESATLNLALIRGPRLQFFTSPDANQFAYLGNNGSATTLAQDLSSPLTAGTTYELQFLQAGFSSINFAARVRVQLAPTGGGLAIYDNDFILPAFTPWTQQRATIPVTTSGSYTIKFSSFTGSAAIIDRVAVVPEAGTTLLAAVGMSALMIRRKRGR